MEPALDVLHRALHGDEGARSFLDRTSSIYVLDATDIYKPHTYGCWNFIHQAMNEIERAEGNLHRITYPHATTAHSSSVMTMSLSSLQFVAHAQLLATMALRVARRSNVLDKQLVATCIRNAAKYQASPTEAQTLIDINVEIRDIVMGRLAALALDPSFHRNNNNNNSNIAGASNYVSAFSDTVVLETFCAVLAANAVSNGPAAVRHLVSEWIVPSSQHLPPFCLTCITLHLAEEASRRLAPLGIQDALQQLSTLVMAGVLAPVLTDAIKESAPESPSSHSHSKTFLSNGLSLHEMNCRIAALSLRAIIQWCAVTDLSLAQIKHICTKVRINIVDTLNDAMYSDSRLVVDALAEFMESVMERHKVVATVSQERMTQVRYIMQVDEDSFRSHITAEQLVAIECKEMTVILDELVSSIGLQRFRFTDRQSTGDEEVCRNLARMAASICDACRGPVAEDRPVPTRPGLLDLLLKAAAHPSLEISGIALEVLTEDVSAETGLVHQLLPILQGRAISPHRFTSGDDGQSIPSILPHENGSGMGIGSSSSFTAFEQFRETVLKECLQACWQAQPKSYLSSCAAAIEEFCRSQSNSVQVSFHLEAALFCFVSIAEHSMNHDQGCNTIILPYLRECVAALSIKPASLVSNPLTLVQACRFVEKYSTWLATGGGDDVLDVAADLCLSTFNLCASGFAFDAVSVEMRKEGGISPYSDAAKALRALLVEAPTHFVSNQAIALLGAGWEASYAAANRAKILTVDDREAMAVGLCHVLASLPENRRAVSLLALAMPALNCLEVMLQHAMEEPQEDNGGNNTSPHLDAILDRLASEIVMVATIATSFSNALQEIGGPSTPNSSRATIREPALAIIKRAWPSISAAATRFNDHESISEAVGIFMTRCIPPSDSTDELASSMLEQLCLLAASMVEHKKTSTEEEWIFAPVLAFAQTMTEIHGGNIDHYAERSLKGETRGDEVEGRARRVGQALESVLLTTAEGLQSLLGPTWANAQRQGNGQSALECQSQHFDQGTLQVSRAALAPMLSLLQACVTHCPFLLLHLPAAKGQDRNEDLLVRRAVESAVASILDSDADTSTSCMDFLASSLRIATLPSSDPVVRQSFEEIISSVRREVLNCILLGICGKFGTGNNLESAAKLLHRLLETFSSNTEDGRTAITLSFSSNHHQQQTDFFLLGPRAHGVVVDCLFKTCQNQVTLEQLQEFVEQIWDLHQSEDTATALAESDSVERFCRRYSSSSS